MPNFTRFSMIVKENFEKGKKFFKNFFEVENKRQNTVYFKNILFIKYIPFLTLFLKNHLKSVEFLNFYNFFIFQIIDRKSN